MSTLALSLTSRSADDRSGTDYYPTPANVTQALMNHLGLSRGTRVWEPACGTGEMSEVLSASGLEVESSDLYETGYGISGRDFLGATLPAGTQWIITNPPFKAATAFIEHALTLGVPFAFLLKSQFWHASSRSTLFQAHPPAEVLALTWRPDFLNGKKGGSPTMECLWTVWNAEPSPDTKYRLLKRP